MDSNQFSHIKEYEVGPGTIDLGRPYEQKMVALISLRCLLQEFDSVQIAFNAAGLGALDDVVVNARRKTGDNIKILLQLKHEEKGKNLVDKLFLTAKGNYSLLKYCEDILKLKEHLECKSTQTSIINDLGTFSNIYFILFTNKGTDKHEFLDNDGCNEISFLNTNANNHNLYKFDLTKVSELSSLPQIDYNFYLFAKQTHANCLEEMIESEMEKVFEYFGLMHYGIRNDENIRVVSKAFIEYVTDWSMGKLGGHYYLTKHAILYKLTELLLKQYELDLSREKFEFYDCPQKELWNEVVNDKRITIVDSDEEVIRFLKLYVGKEIRKYSHELGKTWSSKFLKKEQDWFYNKYESLTKAMHKVAGRNGKISLWTIYKCLWFNEDLPLLLKINTFEDYEVILRILKLSEFKLKVIILSSVKLKPTGIELDYFATLSDLNIDNRLAILDHFVKLQGRSPVALKELISDPLCPLINCNAIINILLGNFNIGIAVKPLPEYFIARSVLKMFLEMDVLKELQDETFVINIEEETADNSVRNSLEEFASNRNVIIVDGHNPIQIEELQIQNKPIHRLVVCQPKFLEWKESFGSTNSIKKYHSDFVEPFFVGEFPPALDTNFLCNELKDVLANRNADNSFNSVNLLSANPGMGKSTVLEHIASIASTDMWVLNVNLNYHDDYYDETSLKTEITAKEHLKYFNDFNLKKHHCSDTQLAQVVFQNFVNKKDVLVLLDAIDEVSITCKKEVIEMIKCIHKAGFSIWLTTRPHLRTELEEQFGTISLTLRPFIINDQKSFLHTYFKQIGETLNVSTNQPLIEGFVEKLLQASRNNLYDRDGEFTCNPLHLTLLANGFKNQFEESIRKGIIKFESKFNLLHLYEEFMKRKDNILREKFGKNAKEMKILFQNHQQLFALKLLFQDARLFRLDIETTVFDYYNNNEDHIKFLQQDGVTVIHRNVNKEPKFQVHFVHRTFAEYLAARWLFNNFNGPCDNSKSTARFLFRERFAYTAVPLLFRMFDCIAAGNSQLHLSIINGRLHETLKLIKSNLDVRDMCGRSILHIIPLYVTDHRTDSEHIKQISKAKNEITKFVDEIPADKIENIKDILGYTPLEYALLNSSFTVGNKLCEKSKELTIGKDTLDLYFIYLGNRWFINPKYKTLLKRILPRLICQKLLLQRSNHNERIVDYCDELFEHNNKATEIIKEWINELGVTTISDLLIKMNIKSADTAETYYYDLRFASAISSILNVQDLILSEYWIEQNHFYTPLFWAIKYDRLEIVKLLIIYGENINEPDTTGITPLQCAVAHGHIEIVRELLSHHADVNLQANNGYTPLSLALHYKHIETAKLLLTHNARVDIKNSSNNFPVYYAAENGLDDLIPGLIKGVDINHGSTYDSSPLLAAIKNGHINTIRVLLRYDADCNIPNKSNKFPIHSAAEEGLDEIVADILCKTLKGVNVRTNGGLTALHFSMYGKGLDHSLSNNRTKIVKFLLNNGADPNIQDNKGNTALHYLCKTCALDNEDPKIVIDLLLNKGADMNLENNDGETPLQLAMKLL